VFENYLGGGEKKKIDVVDLLSQWKTTLALNCLAIDLTPAIPSVNVNSLFSNAALHCKLIVGHVLPV
jgi:hypothetical protein